MLNARMEEMSFRSGVAVGAGVLALTGVGIALTVTLAAGHQAAAVPSAVSAAAVPSSAAPSAAAPYPSAAAPYPSASASPIQETSALAAAPQPQTAPASSAPASPSPSWRRPRRRRLGRQLPGSLNSPGTAPSPGFPPGWGPIPRLWYPGWWWPGIP